MTSPLVKRTRPLRPGHFAREASARRFFSRLDRLVFGTYASLKSWMCENGYGMAADAPPIGTAYGLDPTSPVICRECGMPLVNITRLLDIKERFACANRCCAKRSVATPLPDQTLPSQSVP